MGIIKKLKGKELVGWNGDPEVDIYPISSTSAIYDSDNNSLDSILANLKGKTGNTTVINLGGSTTVVNPLNNSVYPVIYLSAFKGASSDSAALSSLTRNLQSDAPSGWSNNSNVSLGSGESLYLTTARKQGSTYLTWSSGRDAGYVWSTPIRIGGSGQNGQNGLNGLDGLDGLDGLSTTSYTGRDGDGYNYMYCRTAVGLGAPEFNSLYITVQAIEEAWAEGKGVRYSDGLITLLSERDSNGYIDENIVNTWWDHPHGISKEYPREWLVAFRGNDVDGWELYTPEPIPWSNWGHNGIDGDGIEFIFYSAAKDEEAPTLEAPYSGRLGEEGLLTYSNVYINDEVYLTDDFIPSGWHDEYIAPTEEYPCTYVSMRKKEWANSSEEDTKLYGAFSEPKVFSGFTSNGYSMTLDNDSAIMDDLMTISDLREATYIHVSVFYGGENITNKCTISPVNKTWTRSASEITVDVVSADFNADGTKFALYLTPKPPTSYEGGYSQFILEYVSRQFTVSPGIYAYVIRAELDGKTIAEKRFTLTVKDLTVDGSFYKLLITNDTLQYTYEGVRESNTMPTLIALKVQNGVTIVPIEAVTDDPNIMNTFLNGKLYVVMSGSTSNLGPQRNNNGTWTLEGSIPYYSNGYTFTLYEGKGAGITPVMWDLELLDCTKGGRQGDAAVVSGYILTSDNDVVIADDDTIEGFPSLALAQFTLDNSGETFTPYFAIDFGNGVTTIPLVNIGGTDLNAYTPSIDSSTGELTYTMNITSQKLPLGGYTTMVVAYIEDDEGSVTFNGGSLHYRRVASRKQTILVKDFSEGESYKIVVRPNTIGLYSDGSPKVSYGTDATGIKVGYIAIDNIDTESDTQVDVSGNFVANLNEDANIQVGSIVYTIYPITSAGNGSLLSNRLTFNTAVPIDSSITGYQYDLYIKSSRGYQLVDSETLDLVRDGQRGADGKSGYVLTCDNDVVIADDLSVQNFNVIGSATFTLQGENIEGVQYRINPDKTTYPTHIVGGNAVRDYVIKITTSNGVGNLEYLPTLGVTDFILSESGECYFTVVDALLPDLNGSIWIDLLSYTVVASRSQTIQIKNFSNGTAYKLLVTPNVINLFNNRTPDLETGSSMPIDVKAIESPTDAPALQVSVSRIDTNPANNSLEGLFYIIRENSDSGNIVSGTTPLTFTVGTAIPLNVKRYIYELYLTYRIHDNNGDELLVTTIVDSETLDLTTNGRDGINYDITVTPAIIYLGSNNKTKNYFVSQVIVNTGETSVEARQGILNELGTELGFLYPIYNSEQYAFVVKTVRIVNNTITKTQMTSLFVMALNTIISSEISYYEVVVYRRYSVNDFIIVRTVLIPIVRDGAKGDSVNVDKAIGDGILLIVMNSSNPIFKFDYQFTANRSVTAKYIFHNLYLGDLDAYINCNSQQVNDVPTGSIHLVLGKSFTTSDSNSKTSITNSLDLPDTSVIAINATTENSENRNLAENYLMYNGLTIGNPKYFSWVYCSKVTIEFYIEGTSTLIGTDTLYRVGTEGHYWDLGNNAFISIYSKSTEMLNAISLAALRAASALSQIALTAERIDLAVTGGRNMLINSELALTGGSLTGWTIVSPGDLHEGDTSGVLNIGDTSILLAVNIASGNWYKLCFSVASAGLYVATTIVKLYANYNFPIETIKLDGAEQSFTVENAGGGLYYAEIVIYNNSLVLLSHSLDFKAFNNISNSSLTIEFSGFIDGAASSPMLLYRPILSAASSAAVDVIGGTVDITANNFHVTNGQGELIFTVNAAGGLEILGTLKGATIYRHLCIFKIGGLYSVPYYYAGGAQINAAYTNGRYYTLEYVEDVSDSRGLLVCTGNADIIYITNALSSDGGHDSYQWDSGHVQPVANGLLGNTLYLPRPQDYLGKLIDIYVFDNGSNSGNYVYVDCVKHDSDYADSNGPSALNNTMGVGTIDVSSNGRTTFNILQVDTVSLVPGTHVLLYAIATNNRYYWMQMPLYETLNLSIL